MSAIGAKWTTQPPRSSIGLHRVTPRVDRRIGGKPADVHRASSKAGRWSNPCTLCVHSIAPLRRSTTFRSDTFAVSRILGYISEGDFINRSNGIGPTERIKA